MHVKINNNLIPYWRVLDSNYLRKISYLNKGIHIASRSSLNMEKYPFSAGTSADSLDGDKEEFSPGESLIQCIHKVSQVQNILFIGI